MHMQEGSVRKFKQLIRIFRCGLIAPNWHGSIIDSLDGYALHIRLPDVGREPGREGR
jgi:hypothetical protein